MFTPAGLVSIFLGWVVLDRPDQSGVYIAQDMVGGWAYLVADEDGDTCFRGQGSCAGGVDVALRCALMSAAACVPDCSQMRIVVDTRLAHRVVVGLASHDRRLNAAIGGRPASVMTRPAERSAVQVAAAAERAASAALHERERAAWQVAATDKAMGIGEAAEEQQADRCLSAWRKRQGAGWEPGPVYSNAGSITDGSRNTLGGAGPSVARAGLPRSEALGSWLRDIDNRAKSIRSDLQGVKA